MVKKNIISLSGDLASGKGVISDILIERLSYGIYRNGEYFRNLAKEHNMSLEDEAAKRAYNDQKRKDLESFDSVEEHKQALIERFNLENERYFKLYKVHKEDLSNYDLVVDTTDKTPEETAEIIIEEYKKWQSE